MSKIVYATITSPLGEKDHLDIAEVGSLLIPSTYVDVASGEGKTKTIQSLIRYFEKEDELKIESYTEGVEPVVAILDRVEFVNALSENAHNKKVVFDKIDFIDNILNQSKESIIKVLGESGTLFTNIVYSGKMVILNENQPVGYFEKATIKENSVTLDVGRTVAKLDSINFDKVILEINGRTYTIDGFTLENSQKTGFRFSSIIMLKDEAGYNKRDVIMATLSKSEFTYEETWEEEVNKIIKSSIGDEDCDIDEFDDLF